MNTLHFKYAVEVEKTGSITQAADNLYMAQPNLSKAIKELEDTLGITIFERTSKGVVPTVKGRAFLSSARGVLKQIQDMEALARETDEDNVFSISIPRSSYIADGFTHFVSSLEPGRSPEIKIKETNSIQTVNNIVEGRFRMGIIRYQTANESYFLDFLAEKDLRYEPIWTFEYLLLMSDSHPLAGRDRIRSEDLENYTELTHGDAMVPYLQTMEGLTWGAGEKPKRHIIVFERSAQFDLLSHVEGTYMWVSPEPAELVERYGLVQRKCAAGHRGYTDLLIYPQRYRLTELDKRFIDRLFEARNKVAFDEYS